MDEDRGTYSPPTEDHLSYEARRKPSRDQAPITLIVSGILLVGLLIVVVLFWNRGLNSHHGVPPEVGSTLGDYKDTKVQDAQPLQDDADINTGDDNSANAKFANSTEAPALRTSAAPIDEAPPPAAPISGPLPSQANNPAFNPQAASSVTPEATPAPAAQTPKPAPATPNKPLAAVTPPKTAPKAAVVTPAVAATPATATGTHSVQIGAFTSTELADKEYSSIVSSYGLFLSSGAGKHVEKVDSKGATLYRTTVTGFTTAEKAHTFCAALVANGHACFVK